MKVGVRKPNLKKSVKARTTGKIKRKAKSAVNPLYGKKGMGMVTNPKKAVYNKVYNKTTVDPLESVRDIGSGKRTTKSHNPYGKKTYSRGAYTAIQFVCALGVLLGAFLAIARPIIGFIFVVFFVFMFIEANKKKKEEV